MFGDIYVVQACTLVAVIVAVLSQIISDVGYTFPNPRILRHLFLISSFQLTGSKT